MYQNMYYQNDAKAAISMNAFTGEVQMVNPSFNRIFMYSGNAIGLQTRIESLSPMEL